MESNNKKTLIAISVILGVVGILMCFAAAISIIVSEYNKGILEGNSEIVIYQYPVDGFNIDYTKDPVEVYRAKFTSDLEYEQTINSLNGTGYNTVVIKDGKVSVTSSSCRDHICQNVVISKDNIINSKDIACMPNGLLITVEVSK